MPFKIEIYFTKRKISDFEICDPFVSREYFFLFCFVLGCNYKTWSDDKFLISLFNNIHFSFVWFYNNFLGCEYGLGER